MAITVEIEVEGTGASERYKQLANNIDPKLLDIYITDLKAILAYLKKWFNVIEKQSAGKIYSSAVAAQAKLLNVINRKGNAASAALQDNKFDASAPISNKRVSEFKKGLTERERRIIKVYENVLDGKYKDVKKQAGIQAGLAANKKLLAAYRRARGITLKDLQAKKVPTYHQM